LPTTAKPTKTAFNDTVPAMQLISRRCKFCHRVCSNRFNCQKHEAVCGRIKSTVKNKQIAHKKMENVGATVRKINGSKVFYCSRCGFSDSKLHVVNAHLMEWHICTGKREVKVQPGHDYIGTLRTPTGYFQCNVCGRRVEFRSRMLEHMQSHSSLAAEPQGKLATNQETSSANVAEHSEEHARELSSVAGSRSCPKCSRSFASVAKYLHHRAVCRVIRPSQMIQQQAVQRPSLICDLYRFCEQTSDGRWKCKLCVRCSLAHRGDLYKHIRAKHREVCKAKQAAQLTAERQHVTRLCIQLADGLWRCKICHHFCTTRDNVTRHIYAKHGSRLHVDSEAQKQKRFSFTDLCRKQTSNGPWYCRLCEHLPYTSGSAVRRHIRSKHSDMLLKESKKTSAVSSGVTTTTSSSSLTGKNAAVGNSPKKSQAQFFVKMCPGCSQVFTSSRGYKNHARWCVRVALRHQQFVEKLDNGRARCRLCHLTYSNRAHCIQHLRRKHVSLSAKRTNDCAQTDDTAQCPTPADDSMPAGDTRDQCNYDGVIDKTVIKMEN